MSSESGGRPDIDRAMSLRPLLDIALDDERFGALAGCYASRRGGARPHVRRLRPYLLAALAEAEEGSADGRHWSSPPTTSARATWRATCAPTWRRGACATTRPGAPATPRTWRRRRTWSGFGSPRWTPWRAGAAVVVASAVALAEAVPDTSLRPAGLTLGRGEEVDLGEVGDLLVEAGYERIDQVEERGQFAIRGGILDVFGATEERAARRGAVRRRDRADPLVLDLHPALARRGRGDRARRRPPSSRPSTASSPSSR